MKNIGIIGAGNLGLSLAQGIAKSQLYKPNQIFLFRRNSNKLRGLIDNEYTISENLETLINSSSTLIISVLPQQWNQLKTDLAKISIENKHIISTITGVTLFQLSSFFNSTCEIIRAMPNTASAVSASMTSITSLESANEVVINDTIALFNTIGETAIIREENFHAATALNACGIAFFMRCIRAAAQGGTEAGFHSTEALYMAAQTALGAAMLILSKNIHPEEGIDKVTSPSGCTIAGLNEMEHRGFSSAMIKGITKACEKASTLYTK